MDVWPAGQPTSRRQITQEPGTPGRPLRIGVTTTAATLDIVLPVEFERITIDPAKMRGLPCIRELRIPVATILGQLAAGDRDTAARILADFPDLESEDVAAAFEYAAATVQEGHLPTCR